MQEKSTSRNNLFPVFLKAHKLHILVVGGGDVGAEKMRFLLKSSPTANVKLVSPTFIKEVVDLSQQYVHVRLIKRLFEPKDLEGIDILILATNQRATNERIRRMAKQDGILVNVADNPDICDFYLGSIVTKGDLKIGISTNGKSPTLAKRFRQMMEASLPNETQKVLDNLHVIKKRMKDDFGVRLQKLNDITSILKTKTQEMDLDELNKRYLPLTPERRISELYKDFKKEDILLTTSFGTTSVCLLHMFKDKNQPIHFINTTYHFEETMAYKQKLIDLYGLNIIELYPEKERNAMTAEDKLWEKDPDLCCTINKISPLNEIKKKYKVWVSGLMRYQNKHRQNMNIFQEVDGMIKFYPLIDGSKNYVEAYATVHELPIHPLKLKGYDSVGCVHCTKKGIGRNGRWFGFNKTECGLHK